MVFFRPEWLIAATLLPVLMFFRRKAVGVRSHEWGISHLSLLRDRLGKGLSFLFFYYDYLYLFPLAALIGALAAPHIVERSERVWGPGVDIAVAVDISGSMAKRDFEPDRLTFARRFFFRGFSPIRQYDDRFSLIIFGLRAYTLCPLTEDWAAFRKMFESLSIGELGDRTALGDAIGAALARLRSSERKRAIILITDGENNAGELNPISAAGMARRLNIPIYTLFLGREDEGERKPGRISPAKLLEKVSEISGGKSFRLERSEQFENLLKKMPRTVVSGRIDVAGKQLKSYRDISHLFVGFSLVSAMILFFLQIFLFRLFYPGGYPD